MSPFTGKKVKPIKNNALRDHLLHCNHLLSFDNFSILAHDMFKSTKIKNHNTENLHALESLKKMKENQKRGKLLDMLKQNWKARLKTRR